ncbi:MAG: GNAT family N-acetyltransferase [Pseudomonadota bacterium]
MIVRPVLPVERPELRALLAQDPLVNLYLLSTLEQGSLAGDSPRGMFYGLWERDPLGSVTARSELAAVAYASPGGLVVPWAPWSEHAFSLGHYLSSRHVIQLLIGPRLATDALWDGYGRSGRVRTRFDQRLYVCREAAPGPIADGLRLAREEDIHVVGRFASRMMLEDLGYDPAQVSPKAHAQAVRRRIQEGRTWVVERHGELVFKIDLGSTSAEGATVGGTFVVPSLRGQGICGRAMRGVAKALLHSHPVVTLHLNEANAPAIGCYAAAGFVRDAAMRLMVIEPERP